MYKLRRHLLNYLRLYFPTIFQPFLPPSDISFSKGYSILTEEIREYNKKNHSLFILNHIKVGFKTAATQFDIIFSLDSSFHYHYLINW